jgi:putative membrane protein
MEHAAHHANAGGAVLPLLLLTGLLVTYLAAVMRLRGKSRTWRAGRIASFSIGIFLLAVAFVPPVSEFAHGSLRGHMVQHLLLGMFAPLGLVFGAPGTLLLRTVPVPTARRMVGLLRRYPLRLLTHPATAALLDIGGMYLLYLTPLYALALADSRLSMLVHLHFVAAGYLFTWAIAGPDPAPHRPGRWVRLAALFGATAAHAILSKLMYAYGFPRGTPDNPTDLEAAAQWMYYGGDLAEALLAGIFFSQWIYARRPSVLRASTVPAGGVVTRELA